MTRTFVFAAIPALVLGACAATPDTQAAAEALRACQGQQDPRLEAICVAQEKAKVEADLPFAG